MSLQAGTRLGNYEIVSRIGAGGMGEVYKARDTRLNRLVAVKILLEHLADNADIRQRFDQEAQTIAALNHPNICVIHDVGHDGGKDYIVMEYLEGDTLAERLKSGALPPEEAIKIACQVASALDRAHRAGIVHRDLKPANIMLTASGVKLLDFGLAKLRQPLLSTDKLQTMPDKRGLTIEGTIIGTLQYMAPEQLEGKHLDARTDVFALGAVLYEMLTGNKAFEGFSSASLIAGILERQPPPVSSAQPLASVLLDRVVNVCLAKDPEDRWQSAREVLRELEWVSSPGSKLTSQIGPSQVVIPKRSIYHKAVPWLLVAALIAIAILGALRFFPERPADTTVIRFMMAAPDNASFLSGTTEPFAEISPNGRQVVFRAIANGSKLPTLWIRTLESQATSSLSGAEEGALPFWSPDGRYVGFFAQGKLKKIEATGGSTETICDVNATPLGGTWGRTGIVVFASNAGLFSVSSDGGQPAQLRFPGGAANKTYRWPRFLPDSQRFLYIGGPPPFSAYLGSLQLAEPKRLFDAESKVIYASPGFLLYTRQNTLTAQAFDPTRGELTGNAIPLIQSVRTGGNTAGAGPSGATAAFSISDTGILAYRTGTTPRFNMAWYDRGGKPGMPLADLAYFQGVALSPDGRTVAYHIHESIGGDIWVLDLARGATQRFTFTPADHNSVPLWSVDGSEMFYNAYRGGEYALVRKAATGAGHEDVLTHSKDLKNPTSVSPDGSLLMYEDNDPQKKFDIWVLPLKGGGKPAPVLQTEFTEWRGQFSPDGRWMAYVSDESGRSEVYVQPYPPTGAKWAISTAGGDLPKWNSTGKEIFYVGNDKKLMTVTVKQNPTGLDVSSPQALFQTNLTTAAAHDPYCVAPGGQQFLITSNPEEASAPNPVTFVVNWTALLKK